MFWVEGMIIWQPASRSISHHDCWQINKLPLCLLSRRVLSYDQSCPGILGIFSKETEAFFCFAEAIIDPFHSAFESPKIWWYIWHYRASHSVTITKLPSPSIASVSFLFFYAWIFMGTFCLYLVSPCEHDCLSPTQIVFLLLTVLMNLHTSTCFSIIFVYTYTAMCENSMKIDYSWESITILHNFNCIFFRLLYIFRHWFVPFRLQQI